MTRDQLSCKRDDSASSVHSASSKPASPHDPGTSDEEFGARSAPASATELGLPPLQPFSARHQGALRGPRREASQLENCFNGKMSLCSLGCRGTSYVGLAGLQLTENSLLGLKVNAENEGMVCHHCLAAVSLGKGTCYQA